MKISRTTAAAAGLSGLLVVGALLPAVAQEDTATEAPAEAPESDVDDDGTDDTDRGRRGPDVEEFAAALAAELGLDVDTVQEALEAVRDDMVVERQAEMQERRQAWLDERVAAGDLTEEEAAAMLEDGELVPGMDRGPRGHGHGHGPGMTPDGAEAPIDEATPSGAVGAETDAVDA